MTPFASVAILEKLALLKIALCKAPALSNAFSRRTSVMPSVMTGCLARVALFPVTDMAEFREKRSSIQRRGFAYFAGNTNFPAPGGGQQNPAPGQTPRPHAIP